MRNPQVGLAGGDPQTKMVGLGDLVSNQNDEHKLLTSDAFCQEVERCSELLTRTLDGLDAETENLNYTSPSPDLH